MADQPNASGDRLFVATASECGFEQEGYLKKHYLKDGQLIDAGLYGLLK